MKLNLLKTKQELTFKNTILGIQFLFVAFGATVLVPLLVGIDPSVALFTAGVGTLLFHVITKGIVPVFLGSSFAFIAPIVKSTELYGLPGTFGGIIAVGLVYGIMSGLVKAYGILFIERLFPKVVIGPVIMTIGLSLAPTAVNMAKTDWLLAIIALVTAITVVVAGKGMVKLIPVFIGIIVGYVAGIFLGKVDFSAVSEASWIMVPSFTAPEFNWAAILFMVPVAVAPLIEHIGDIYAISSVADKNFIEKTGVKPDHAGRRAGHLTGRCAGKCSQHHLLGSHRSHFADQSDQPLHFADSGHHGHCLLAGGKNIRLPEDHSTVSAWRDYAPPVWNDSVHWDQNTGRWQNQSLRDA